MDNCCLNPYSEEYNGMCFSCVYYYDYGHVGGRGDYNGRCTYDKHETDALVKCKINRYSHI
jgi:hypothetical protein